jgi:hypothetical protein
MLAIAARPPISEPSSRRCGIRLGSTAASLADGMPSMNTVPFGFSSATIGASGTADEVVNSTTSWVPRRRFMASGSL